MHVYFCNLPLFLTVFVNFMVSWVSEVCFCCCVALYCVAVGQFVHFTVDRLGFVPCGLLWRASRASLQVSSGADVCVLGVTPGALHNAERAFTPLSLGLALCDLNSSRHLLVSAFFPEVGRCFSALAFCASQKASVSSVLCYLRNQVTCVMRQSCHPTVWFLLAKLSLEHSSGSSFILLFGLLFFKNVLLRLAFRKRDEGRWDGTGEWDVTRRWPEWGRWVSCHPLLLSRAAAFRFQELSQPLPTLADSNWDLKVLGPNWHLAATSS